MSSLRLVLAEPVLGPRTQEAAAALGKLAVPAAAGDGAGCRSLHLAGRGGRLQPPRRREHTTFMLCWDMFCEKAYFVLRTPSQLHVPLRLRCL